MALVSRKSGGGRKPSVVPNPFIIIDEYGEPFNDLWCTEDKLDIYIEDILVGVVRCLSVCGGNVEGATVTNQNDLAWTKLLRIYRNVESLDAKSIQNYLRCSRTTSNRYLKAIKLANPFLKRYMDNKVKGEILQYIDVTPKQIQLGYLRIL